MGTCQICQVDQASYSCPRCFVPYCSLKCYKSKAHLECSELFYKGQIESQVRDDRGACESSDKMIQILHRQMENQQNSDESALGEVPMQPEEIAEMLEEMSVKEMWELLSVEERKEFDRQLLSGSFSGIEPWNPWWSKDTALVEDLSEESNDDYPCKCELDALIVKSAKFSPRLLPYLIEILVSYIQTCLLYNGDFVLPDFINDLMAKSRVLQGTTGSNICFESVEQVLRELCVPASFEGDSLASLPVLIRELNCFLRSPSNVGIALSHIHKCVKLVIKHSSKRGNSTNLFPVLKKIEFYYSYFVSDSKGILSSTMLVLNLLSKSL